jgi:hypothetical protein
MWPPILMSYPKDLWFSQCRALSKGAIATYFKRVSLAQPAEAGLELTTTRILSESTTTRQPQTVLIIYLDQNMW